jgi:nitronate monooxygenase
LALGGEGIVMGPRFVATQECIIHPNFKQWMVEASENDTILIQRSIKNMIRAMKNEAALRCLEMEQQGATLQELLTVISGKKSKACVMAGDLQGSIFATGQAMGLIDEIKPVKQVIEDVMKEAEQVLVRLDAMKD